MFSQAIDRYGLDEDVDAAAGAAAIAAAVTTADDEHIRDLTCRLKGKARKANNREDESVRPLSSVGTERSVVPVEAEDVDEDENLLTADDDDDDGEDDGDDDGDDNNDGQVDGDDSADESKVLGIETAESIHKDLRSSGSTKNSAAAATTRLQPEKKGSKTLKESTSNLSAKAAKFVQDTALEGKVRGKK